MYEDIVGLSHGQCTGDLNTLFQSAGWSFQKVGKPVFSNGKTRRAVPDQPAMSRFLQQILATGKVEEFGNLVLHALLRYVKGEITPDQAAKEVFPLLVSRAPGSKIRKIAGNETYVRDLYRRRWAIEIVFREMHKLSIAN